MKFLTSNAKLFIIQGHNKFKKGKTSNKIFLTVQYHKIHLSKKQNEAELYVRYKSSFLSWHPSCKGLPLMADEESEKASSRAGAVVSVTTLKKHALPAESV